MENISVNEVKKRLAAGEKMHFVDVREPDEHAEFNIGGILLPLGDIQSLEIDAIEPIKDEEIILYCRSGNRSFHACMFLEMSGFKNVKNLAGGMNEWRGL